MYMYNLWQVGIFGTKSEVRVLSLPQCLVAWTVVRWEVFETKFNSV